jgi:hypothetical protein
MTIRNTRYYSKKSQSGVFFSKLPKDQQGPSETKDGRIEYRWTFGDKSGSSWGYESTELQGSVVSAYIDESDYGTNFCMGLAHELGQDVLQVPMFKEGKLTSDIVGMAKKLRGIKLDEDLLIGLWMDTKSAWSAPNGTTFTPCRTTLKQPGVPYPAPVPGTWEYKDGAYEGLPGPVITTRMGKEVLDFSGRDEVLYGEIVDFCARVVASGNRDKVPATPAEVAAGNADDDEDDFPF